MNDRFKFRAWDKIHKRYIYCDFAGYCSVDYSGNGEKRIVFMPSGVEQIKNGRPLLYAKEDEVEIEQCTGLKEKNGKLIYEGDIIREISKKEPEWEEYVTEVKWKVCGFNIYDAADFYFEVIGNIHENKELLDE